MGSLSPQTSPLLPALVPSSYESTGVKRGLGSSELCQVSLTPLSLLSWEERQRPHMGVWWVFAGVCEL